MIYPYFWLGDSAERAWAEAETLALHREFDCLLADHIPLRVQDWSVPHDIQDDE
jgi:hypothetical protein